MKRGELIVWDITDADNVGETNSIWVGEVVAGGNAAEKREKNLLPAKD